MENAYGIGVKNRYELFLSLDDPLEVLKVQEQEKEAKKKTKLSEKENKGKLEARGKPAPAVRKGIKETQNFKSQDQQKTKEDLGKAKAPPRGNAERVERVQKYSPESREERNNRRNREDKPQLAGGEFHREERSDRFERREVRNNFNRDGDRNDNREFRGGGGVDGESRRGRGGLGGRGGPPRGRGARAGGGGRGFDGRGKREFDRQSGSDKTGIKPVDKRDGGGAHNWGSHRDDIDEVNNTGRSNPDESGDWGTPEKGESDAQLTENSENKDTKDVTNGPEGDDGEAPPPAEEERKELTLDEWKALRGNRQKPQYNLRKAGEGEDPSQWKKMYALQKKKEGEDEEEDEEEYDSSEYPQRVGRQKHVLDINFHFYQDSRLGGRPRGGRGGPGGRGSRVGTGNGNMNVKSNSNIGGSPGDRGSSAVRERDRESGSYQGSRGSRQSAPKVDDEHDFPSLG